MNKFLIVLVAALAIESAFTANVTAGASVAGSNTAATCTSGLSFTTNCAFCNTPASGAQTYCVACNPLYQLGNTGNTNGPSVCSASCSANCLFCAGDLAPGASNAAPAAGQSAYCQADNSPVTGAITYATAICRNITTAGVTTYATPGNVAAGAANGAQPANTYNCYPCLVSNCINCRPASGTNPTTAASVTTCQQCQDGYYLDSNATADATTKVVAGTACTACKSIASVNGTTSNSAYIVVGVCNKCVNGTNGCINATCTRFVGTTAGTGSSDTTSFTFDISKQQCVSKSAGKLVVAFAGIVAIAFATLI